MRLYILIFVLILSSLSGDNSIYYLKGRAVIERDGRRINAVKGQVLKKGDIFRTSARSTAILKLHDSKLKVRPGSTVVLDELKEAPQTGRTIVALKAGSFFAKIKKLSDTGSFQARSQGVVVGVRGTEFFFSYGKKDEKKDSDLWLCVNEGIVNVKSIETEKEVLVKEGEGIVIPGGREVTPPKKYEWTRDLNWNLEASRGKVEDKTRLEDIYSDILDVDYD